MDEKQIMRELNKLYVELTLLKDWNGEKCNMSYISGGSMMTHIEVSPTFTQLIIESRIETIIEQIKEYREQLGLKELGI